MFIQKKLCGFELNYSEWLSRVLCVTFGFPILVRFRISASQQFGVSFVVFWWYVSGQLGFIQVTGVERTAVSLHCGAIRL